MPLPPHDQVDAVVRGLRTVERDGVSERALVVQRTLPAPVTEVWEALTSAERVRQWFAPVSGDLRPGGRYQLEGNAGGQVLACDPPRTLALTWEYDGRPSWVEVDLAPDQGSTRLLLEHVAPLDEAMWEQFGPGAVGIGWEMALMGLHEHVRSPGADPREIQEWVAGPEGRRFLTELTHLTGEQWVRASIAFGTDPEDAAAAGERCAAAYTVPPEG